MAAVVVLMIASTCALAGLDSGNSRAVALGASSDPGQVVERTWVAVAGAPQPPRDGAMAYDTVRHQTVVAGPGTPESDLGVRWRDSSMV